MRPVVLIVMMFKMIVMVMIRIMIVISNILAKRCSGDGWSCIPASFIVSIYQGVADSRVTIDLKK